MLLPGVPSYMTDSFMIKPNNKPPKFSALLNPTRIIIAVQDSSRSYQDFAANRGQTSGTDYSDPGPSHQGPVRAGHRQINADLWGMWLYARQPHNFLANLALGKENHGFSPMPIQYYPPYRAYPLTYTLLRKPVQPE